MHLHGPFSETDIASELFTKAALRDMNHDLALARAQRFKTFPESLKMNRLLSSV